MAMQSSGSRPADVRGGPPPPLDHERLEVYQVGRALTRAVADVLRKVPSRSGHSEALDDLRRAVKSIVHNITEASGEEAPLEKAKFCRYARRSATECAGGLDYLVDFGLIQEQDTWSAKWLIHRCVSMLVKLIRSLEDRAARERAARRGCAAAERTEPGSRTRGSRAGPAPP